MEVVIHIINSSVMIWGLLYAKEMTFKGKDGLTSVLQNLTNDLAWANAEDNISRMGMGDSKGQPLTVVAEMGMNDTDSDGYR